jgi:hypothetical protein
VLTSCLKAVPFGNYWGIFSQGRSVLGEIAETLLAPAPLHLRSCHVVFHRSSAADLALLGSARRCLFCPGPCAQCPTRAAAFGAAGADAGADAGAEPGVEQYAVCEVG